MNLLALAMTIGSGFAQENTLSEEERKAGWKLLFDGRTTSGWRGFKSEGMPPGWKVIEGALVRVSGGAGGKGAGGGDDLVTADEYENFELALEWKVVSGGNSGILYRVKEDVETSWHSAPEMQVLDNSKYGKRDRRQVAGACYDLYAPAKEVARPAGEWNRVRILADGNRIEHWLNGERILRYELGSEDWKRRIARSKFKNMPGFARNAKGHVCLQDHSQKVGFRNIKIRVLDSPSTAAAPFDGKAFRGRIAWSADGNFNDPDDWAASPVALAILAEFGVKEKLVHFDYNCILYDTDAGWEKTHGESVLGAARTYGFPESVFKDCRKDLEAAVESLRKAVDASSAEDPLYFIVAGPMEVPYLGIERSDPEKRKHVTVISHSRWNDGYTPGTTFKHTKRSVIPQGIQWVQISDQNRLLSTSPYGRPSRDDEWRPWEWMRDSDDPKVRFLWERMRVSTRGDCSDAGMAYFLLSGDEETDIPKLRKLLDENVVPAPVGQRRQVRIEAENFVALENLEVEFRNDREASHRLGVRRAGAGAGRLRTAFRQPYAAGGRYDVDVRYSAERPARLALSVNGARKGEAWAASGGDAQWKTHTIAGVNLDVGDEILLEVEGDARVDYVQLAYRDPASPGSRAPLDDPDALPGQVVVAGPRPGHLKYNGGGPVFLSGPDNPEEFLFRGTLVADGTRSGGGQEELVRRMARAGVNAFHCQMFRMKRCNIKNEGDDSHCPFVDADPSKPLNEAVLSQWEGWLDLLESANIVVHLEFYNDATDVERMGWTLDAAGDLHPDERRFIEGIVTRFKHHRNILWGIEESCNKLPAARTAHFRKIGEVIARTDNHHHPIVQSFVVPDDPDGDFPPGGVMTDPYVGDPHIRVVTWLHVAPQGEDLERQHREYLRYYSRDAANFVVMKNETYHHPRKGALSRKYMWSAAMAGLHTLEAYHPVDKTDEATLRDDGRIRAFLEQTDFPAMKPRDELAAGSTKWVLADPGESYVAYTYDASGPMGVRGLATGAYDLKWFDPVDGKTVMQAGVAVTSGDATWTKPEPFGREVALHIRRRGEK